MTIEQAQSLLNELVADGVLPEDAIQVVDWAKFDAISLRTLINLLTYLKELYA